MIAAMRAVLVREFGGPEVLRVEDAPEPEAQHGQVRVRVSAIGVNPYDTYMRTGQYAKRPPLPYSPGADAAGIIDQVGAGVKRLDTGARVWVGGTAQDALWGAYAEVIVCERAQVHALPDRLTFAQGAAINVPYVTAYRALVDRAQAQPGEVVFIHGASGGVGAAATQIARAAGMTIIGSAGSAGGLDFVRAQGAHHVVNHRQAGYLDELGALTDGRGPDVIIEMLANVNLDHDLSAVAPKGRIVIVGNRGRVEIDPRKMMGKDSTLLGMTLWNVPPSDLSRIHHAIEAGLDRGALTPGVGQELPLEEASRAHEVIVESAHRGKIVLVT